MSDQATAQATPTSNGASGAPIVLSDDPIDLIGGEPAKAAPTGDDKGQAPAQKEPANEQTPDELVLELSKRGRELEANKKAVAAKEKELAGLIAQHKQFAEVLALAKSDPYGFIEKMADAAGLDPDAAIEGYTARKSGGQRTLTEAERLERLEREREQERADREKRETQEREQREREDGDKAVAAHVDSLKSLAKAGEENFPLFCDDIDTNAAAAFDLMVLAHNAGKDMSHAAAVAAIEKTLREDTERRAGRLGFRKDGQPTNQATAPVTPTQPRATTTASVAPPAQTFAIKSDDEIAADWATSFGGR